MVRRTLRARVVLRITGIFVIKGVAHIFADLSSALLEVNFFENGRDYQWI
jgi:hypothetical protein